MINAPFASLVATVSHEASTRIVSRGAQAFRSFALEGGFIVASESSLPAEGLIAMLAAEQRLDGGLVEPLRAAAAQRRLLPEYLLVEEKLLQPGEVVGALERVATLQFRAALLGQGEVAAASSEGVVRRGIRLHAGALLLEQFRVLPLDEVRQFLGPEPGTLRFHAPESVLMALRLQPAELRIVRASRLDVAATQDHRAARLAAALSALGFATRR